MDRVFLRQKGPAHSKQEDIQKVIIECLESSPNCSVSELIGLAKKSSGYDRASVAQALYDMRENKKIAVVEGVRSISLLDYVLSPQSVWFWLSIFFLLSAISLLLATFGAALYLRYVFGTVLVLFLPGYSLLKIIYPNKKPFSDLAMIAISIGLSMAILVFMGLLVSYLPAGLDTITVATSITAVSITLLTIALLRRYQIYEIMAKYG